MGREMTRSKQLYEQARKLIPGGVNSPVRAFRKVGGSPIYFREASGSRCTDVDGNCYVDFCQSWGPLILGHAHPEVVEAVRAAAARGLSFGACHEGEIELAGLILEAFPEHDRVRAVSSGTEAVMTALRLARGYTGRQLVLKFDGGYHGHYDGMLVKAGSGLVTEAIADSRGVPGTLAETTLVAPLDDETAVRKIFEAHGQNIAAIIIEPLPANNGLLVQRREFLAFLREICREFDALLIFDEVISGFRLKFGGYGQMVGVGADIVVLGKIVGGGMPVGAVSGRAEIMDMLAPLGDVYQAGTLSGNPVGVAAGIATLKALRHNQPYERLQALGRCFVGRLAEAGLPAVQAVQAGSILWLYLDAVTPPRRADAISSRAMARFNRLYWPLLHSGFYLPPSPYEVFFLSTAHTEGDVEDLADAVQRNLSECEAP